MFTRGELLQEGIGPRGWLAFPPQPESATVNAARAENKTGIHDAAGLAVFGVMLGPFGGWVQMMRFSPAKKPYDVPRVKPS